METQLLPALLRANPYPGRGILLGRSADGQSAVAAYFIMGRSENSRNRVFVETEDGIQKLKSGVLKEHWGRDAVNYVDYLLTDL